MSFQKFAAALLVVLAPAAAQSPLPKLRIEPSTGGSVFYIKNTASQPVTASRPGAGIGIGRIGGSALESIARQPESLNDIRSNMILAAALVEGAAFFAMVVALLVVFKQ